MKSFLFKIVRILPVLIAIMAFNYFLDPFLVLNSNKQNEIVNHFLEGKHVAFRTGYNGYILKSKYLEQQKTPIEIVVLGSSRSNQIGNELFKGNTFFNACLNSSKLSDLLGVWQLIEENHHHPKKIILELNSQVLQLRHSRNRKWLIPFSNKMLEKMNFNDLVEIDPISIRLKMKAKSLFSIEYGLKGWGKDFYEVWNPKDSLVEYVAFADGSEKARDHHLNSRIPQKERLLQMFKRKQFEMQTEAAELYIQFIQYLQNKGIKVVIYIPPASSGIYENKTVRAMEFDLEEFIQKMRADSSLEIIGGLNPADFNLNSEHYTDDVHFRRNAMKLIFQNKLD